MVDPCDRDVRRSRVRSPMRTTSQLPGDDDGDDDDDDDDDDF